MVNIILQIIVERNKIIKQDKKIKIKYWLKSPNKGGLKDKGVGCGKHGANAQLLFPAH